MVSIKKTKAFTLIELLVVVAIIGILAAVGVVAYNGYTSAAKISATKANHKIVVKFFTNTMQLVSLSSSNTILQYWQYPQCTHKDSGFSPSTDVGSYSASYTNKFRCEIKNAFDNKDGFTIQKSGIPTVVGRMNIWPDMGASSITFNTRWGTGANEYLTNVIYKP